MKRFTPTVLLLLLFAGPLLACMWDYDTLKQERAQSPGTLELITGKFLRHSPEFYQWRIQDRLKKLKNDPNNLSYHDDLAVAYSKVGQNEKAIETILKKDAIKPGLYETNSNLGTFYILAGEFQKGLPYIDKALSTNPNAHFGREKYQKWLVEYALSICKDGKIKFPLNQDLEKVPSLGFQKYLELKVWNKNKFQEQRAEAIIAIQGMMRFANHENPLLLEALGDLLQGDYSSDSHKRLAARCYLKASDVVTDPEVKKKYREYAAAALHLQVEVEGNTDEEKLATIEREFRSEQREANTWYAELAQKEKDWIAQGKDVEAEFDKLYTMEPAIADTPEVKSGGEMNTTVLIIIGVAAFIVVDTAIMLFVLSRIRARKKEQEMESNPQE